MNGIHLRSVRHQLNRHYEPRCRGFISNRSIDSDIRLVRIDNCGSVIIVKSVIDKLIHIWRINECNVGAAYGQVDPSITNRMAKA